MHLHRPVLFLLSALSLWAMLLLLPGQADAAGSSDSRRDQVERVEKVGLAKGCDRIDGLLSCEVIAEGWRYLIMDDGRSDAALIAQLDQLEMNRKVEISGEVIAYGDRSTQITLSRLSVHKSPAGPYGMAKQALIGAWRSLDDAHSTLRFTPDGHQYSYYQGDLLDKSPFTLSQSCPLGIPGNGEVILVVNTPGETQPFCYEITLLENSRLDLIYLGRGNTLRYVRYE